MVSQSLPPSPAPSAGIPQRLAASLGRFWESEETPAWLISLIVHTLLLILLTLWQWPDKPGQESMLLGRISSVESPEPVTIRPTDASGSPGGELAAAFDPSSATQPDPAQPTTDPPELPTGEATSRLASDAALAPLPIEIPVISPPVEMGRVDASDSLREEVSQLLAASRSGSGERSALPPGMRVRMPQGGMSPRTAASRGELGARYGATAESEAAVEAALAWLAQHQRLNGSWSFDLRADPCNGRCRHSSVLGDSVAPTTAGTGLALLAFLGAGYTHHEGKYAETVRRGIYYLREEARPAQFGRDLQAGSMYGHGIASLALTEVLNIDRQRDREDEDIRNLVEDVLLFTMVAQHPAGGWRYIPGSPGDMTVSGWQILSLVSGRYAGVPLRSNTLHDARRFVRSLAAPDSFQFGYVSPEPEPTTTAIGLAMLLYLGESPFQTPFQQAMWALAERGPKLNDVYHDYYAALALHNVRHEGWERWHVPLREHLIRTQATAGHEKGSWHFPDLHGDVGGRLYTTAMATLILEVYYRHLPLYQEHDEFPLN
jgi:hypothetical protein